MTLSGRLARASFVFVVMSLSACNCGDGSQPDASADDAGATDAGGSADASVTDGGADAGTDDAGTDDAGTDDAGTDDAGTTDAGTTDAGTTDAGTTDAGCVATGAEVCDGLDNDCNGLVDDVDVGLDGIYDCLKIAVLGQPGQLASSDFAAWLTSNGTTVTRLQQTTTEPLTSTTLADYNVVILDRLMRDYTPTEAGALSDWVAAGGGLVVMSGYIGSASDWTRPNSLLLNLNLGLASSLRNGPVTTFVPHPLTDGLTSVTFSGGYNVGVVTSDGGLAAPDAGATAVVVASLPSGPVGICDDTGRGRVFVWGDEWIEFDSEWRSVPQIRRFWVNILGWVTHSR